MTPLILFVLGGLALLAWLVLVRHADLVQTAANVVYFNPSTVTDGIAGAPVANISLQAGMPAFTDGTNWFAAGAGGNVQQSGSLGVGIAVNRADGVNQPVRIWRSGTINLGATLVVGKTYVLSATGGTGPGGKIAPISDIATGNFVTILGVANNVNNLVSPPGGALASQTASA